VIFRIWYWNGQDAKGAKMFLNRQGAKTPREIKSWWPISSAGHGFLLETGFLGV
jgi:hypothetical protein